MTRDITDLVTNYRYKPSVMSSLTATNLPPIFDSFVTRLLTAQLELIDK